LSFVFFLFSIFRPASPTLDQSSTSPPPPHLKPKINPLLGGDCGRKRLKLGIRSFRKNAVAVVNLHQLYINFPSHSEFHENQITPKKTIKFHHFVNHLMTTAVVRKVRMRRMWTTPGPTPGRRSGTPFGWHLNGFPFTWEISGPIPHLGLDSFQLVRFVLGATSPHGLDGHNGGCSEDPRMKPVLRIR